MFNKGYKLKKIISKALHVHTYIRLKKYKVYLMCLTMVMMNTVSAQDLEPRRWTPLPAGATILGMGYGHISGEVGFDPVLEIEDAKVKRDFFILNYTQYFSLEGQLMRFDALVPFQKVQWDGILSKEPASDQRTGMGDPLLRLSINLMDATTLASKKSDDPQKTINTVLGAAIAVNVPFGEYYKEKLLNLGSNRYTIRPQIGVVHTRGPWSYELTGSIFYFTDNDNFYYVNKLKQKPFYAVQAHIIRVFSPGVWGSLSAGYGKGGASKINSESIDDEREGIISGLSFGIPIAPDQGLKFSYIWKKTQTPIVTISETNTFALSWSISF